MSLSFYLHPMIVYKEVKLNNFGFKHHLARDPLYNIKLQWSVL